MPQPSPDRLRQDRCRPSAGQPRRCLRSPPNSKTQDQRGRADLVRPPRHCSESEVGHLLRRAHENGVAPTWLLKGTNFQGRLATRMYCPLCLEQCGYWRSAWDDAAAYCANHRVWLVDRCGRCGARLFFTRLTLFTCRCGFDLRRIVGESVGREVLALCRRGAVADTLASWLGALVVAGLAGKPGKRLESRDLRTARGLLLAGAHVLEEWPGRFHALLDVLRVPCAEIAHVQLFNQAFPGLLRMFRRLPEGQDRHSLIQAIDAYVRRTWSSSVPILGRNVARCPSQRDVARRLGVGVGRLMEAAEQLSLNHLCAGDRRGKNRRVFREGEVRRTKAEVQGATAPKRVAAILGIGVQRIWRLEDAGLLRRVSGQFRRRQIDEFARAVENASPIVEANDGMPLGEILRYTVPLHKTVSFFHAMQRGAISRTSRTPARFLGEVLLSRSSVETWWSQDRHCAALTLREAAQLLGVKEEVISHLVRSQLLPTRRVQVGRRSCATVDAAQMRKFQATYAPLARLAREAGISPKHAPRWASEVGIILVCGPTIDGSRQYIARRRPLDLQRLRRQDGAKA